MMSLVKPRLVALDSAQLGNWARDRVSSSIQRRTRAQQFEQELLDRGFVVLFCWHHLAELLSTENDTHAAACVALISSLPVVAWVGHADGSEGMGSIVDILAQEARTAFEAPGSNVDGVRDMTARRLIRMGSGVQAFAPYALIWRQLKPFFQGEAERIRQIVAITRAAPIDIGTAKIADLMAGRVRQPDGIARQLANMQLALQREVATRGDKRISAPEEVARQFVERVIATATPLMGEPDRLPARLLELMHVHPAEIGPDATMADINAISIFRQQIISAAEAAGQTWNIQNARQIDMNQIPSWVIQTALRKYRQDLPERKGSEMNDGYLACLAPYADVLFVDKRTMENLRRALPKMAPLRRLVQNVQKTSLYSRAVLHLS